MSHWPESVSTLIYELYGFSFLLLGVVAYLVPKRDPTLNFASRLWLLALFGITHGVREFLASRTHDGGHSADLLLGLDLVLLLVSYFALLEFGRSSYCARPGARQLNAGLIHGAAGVLSVALMRLNRDALGGLAFGARCFVGLPGALLTGLSLLAHQPGGDFRLRSLASWQRLAGVAFVLYGATTPIVARGAASLPAWWPDETGFIALTDMPVQLLRAMCAAVVTVAFAALARYAGVISNNDLMRVISTLNGFVYRCNNDRDWTLIYMTGGVEELCGYRAEQFLAPNTLSWGGLIHAQDADRVWSEVKAGLAARRDFELSYRITARDGAVRWVYERGRGVFDANGTLRFLDGHVMNDTVHMQALTELRIKDAAIESSLNAIAMTGVDGTIRYVNKAFCELLQMLPQDAIGRHPLELMEDEAEGQVALAAVARQGRFQGVLRARRGDGSVADMQVLAHRVLDAAGEPHGVMSSFVDITEQVRLAAELRRERDFATSLVGTAPVIILLLDTSGRIRHINPYGEALLGYTLDELRGRDWVADFVPQRERERLQALFVTAMGGVQTRGNVNAIVTRSGEEREIEWTDQMMYDAQGKASGLLAIGLDVTDRKRSLEALRANQKQSRDILDGIFAFVGLFSLEGEVLDVNRAPLLASGLQREDLVGHKVWDTPLLDDSRQSVQAAFHRAAAGELVRRDVQLRLQPGKCIVVDAAFCPVRDERGRIVRVVGSAVDVTEQRELQAQRLELEAQLRQSQKLEALGTLAGGIAHDFNNVLMAILGNVELAQHEPEDAAALGESLTEIDKAARRAQDLVQRILAFSRRQDHALKQISVVPVVQEALQLLRSTLPSRVELQFAAGEDDAPVMADASQVHQVIMNLATNAWHALDDRPGKIAVRIATEWLAAERGAQVELSAGRYVHVAICDTGSGMSAPVLQRIFEPFFTTKPAGQGTGLGLSVVHGIMKSHHGAVAVDSVLGTGTTVHLYFPVAHPGEFREDAPLSLVPQRGGGEHLLLVDDEQLLLDIGARSLRSMGYHVTSYSRGEQALAAFRANPAQFDLVVTDHNMPGMSGIELAREIKQVRPCTPVVLISGFLREDELQRALDLGVGEVVMKPTTFERLGAVIRALLERGRDRQRAEVA